MSDLEKCLGHFPHVALKARKFASGECGALARINPGTLPPRRKQAVAAAQNGRVNDGTCSTLAATSFMPIVKTAVAAAPPHTKRRVMPDGTKKIETAKLVRAGLNPQRPSFTSFMSAPTETATRTPMSEPSNVAAAAPGLYAAMPASIKAPAIGLLTTKICDTPVNKDEMKSAADIADTANGAAPDADAPAKGFTKTKAANAIALKASVQPGTGDMALPMAAVNGAEAAAPTTVTAKTIGAGAPKKTEKAQPTRVPL